MRDAQTAPDAAAPRALTLTRLKVLDDWSIAPLLTKDSMREVLGGVSLSTVNRILDAHPEMKVMIGRAVRIDPEELRSYTASRRI